MKVKEVNNKEEWEKFFLNQQEKTFLQSWNWGEFQKKIGNKIWRLGVYNDKDEIALAVLLIKIEAKRGTFLLSQHCVSLSEELLKKIKEIAMQEEASFIRMAPLLIQNQENEELFSRLGFRNSPMHANAYTETWKLDVTLPEDDLLSNMRKATRYLIKRALKSENLSIEQSKNIKDLVFYQDLNFKVSRYQKFVPFSYEFIKNEFETFLKDDQALLFLGKYQGNVVASALVIFWSGIAFYHQAALDPQYRKVPVAYLLQFEAIKEAKKRNCKFYDFWGYVDPIKHPKHPWAGPTLFKMGFGGKSYHYLKTKDLPLLKKYWLNYFIERLRKLKRGL